MKALRLYALGLSDGSVKLGISTNPVTRMRQWANGRTVDASYVSAGLVTGFRAESDLLRRAEACSQKRVGERFFGLKFGEAVTLINQMARRWQIERPTVRAPLGRRHP